jgi:hypothetical protein
VSSQTIPARIVIRRDTAANWTATNPVLLSGEWGFETNTRQLKIGDGTSAWNALGYYSTGGGGGGGATAYEVRIDSTSTANTIYVGKAAAGTSEASAAWAITRTQFTTAGVQTASSSRSAVTWTGRTSHTYP